MNNKEVKKEKISVMDLVPIAKIPLLNRRKTKKVPVKSLKSYIADEYKLVDTLDKELKTTLRDYNQLVEKHEKLDDEYNALLVVNEKLDERVKAKTEDIEEYKSTISQLKLEIKQLKEKHKSEVADLKVINKELEKEKKELEKQIKELSKPKKKSTKK